MFYLQSDSWDSFRESRGLGQHPHHGGGQHHRAHEDANARDRKAHPGSGSASGSYSLKEAGWTAGLLGHSRQALPGDCLLMSPVVVLGTRAPVPTPAIPLRQADEDYPSVCVS